MWGGTRLSGPAGQQRHFSTYQPPDKMHPKSHGGLFQFAPMPFNIQPDKHFRNPNYVNPPQRSGGPLYETCSKFINGSNGYPNNVRKTVTEETQQPPPKSDPVDIKETSMKNDYKKPPHRSTWHKRQQISMELLLDIDEVGTDACEDVDQTSPASHYPTLADFMGSPKQITDEIIITLPHSPICIQIGTPVCFSVSPPKPSGRQRIVSECGSVDSYITFGDGESSEEDTDASEWDDTDDEESDFIDFRNTPKTDCELDTNRTRRKVTFAPDKDLVEVHHMHTWNFAYRASRKGCWEEFARDRERFKRRIDDCNRTIGRVLDAGHRLKIYSERFETTS